MCTQWHADTYNSPIANPTAIDAADFEQGKAAAAQDALAVALDIAAMRKGLPFSVAANYHFFAVTALLVADQRTDESGSPARRAFYA